MANARRRRMDEGGEGHFFPSEQEEQTAKDEVHDECGDGIGPLLPQAAKTGESVGANCTGLDQK